MRMTIRRWQAALMGGVVLGWLGGARVEAYAQSLLWLGALDGLFAFGGAGTGNARHEDIDKDGIVDDADLLAVLFAFGQGCN